MRPPVIGITLGDPSGIGPEIVAQTIATLSGDERNRIVVFCDRPLLERAFSQRVGTMIPEDVCLVNRDMTSADEVPLGTPTVAGAAAQVAYLEAAVHAALAGEIAGLVTAPISKSQVAQVGWRHRGHTNYLADRLGAKKVAMMFAGPKLKVVLATVHVALRDVPEVLTQERVFDVIGLAVECLQRDYGVSRPRIGVVGLNPHAGEAGLLGKEEQDVLIPAIEHARRVWANVADISQPLVPDVAFRLALDGQYDLLIAMYHDQGLIPVKLIDFEQSVNMTLGLPIVRTCPDHGVAYDIAGTGTARADSFGAALGLAFSLVDRASARSRE